MLHPHIQKIYMQFNIHILLKIYNRNHDKSKITNTKIKRLNIYSSVHITTLHTNDY